MAVPPYPAPCPRQSLLNWLAGCPWQTPWLHVRCRRQCRQTRQGWRPSVADANLAKAGSHQPEGNKNQIKDKHTYACQSGACANVCHTLPGGRAGTHASIHALRWTCPSQHVPPDGRSTPDWQSMQGSHCGSISGRNQGNRCSCISGCIGVQPGKGLTISARA